MTNQELLEAYRKKRNQDALNRYHQKRKQGYKSYTVKAPPEAIEAVKDFYRKWKAEHYHKYWKRNYSL